VCGTPQPASSQPASSQPGGSPETVPPVSTAPAPQPVAAAPAKQGGGALKTVLIVIGVVVVLMVLVAGGLIGTGIYFAHKLKDGVHVEQSGDNATVKTPWGNFSATNDPAKVAEQLKVDVYTHATPLREGSSSGNFGGISVATARFETSDSMDQVEQFYKARYPKSTMSTADENSRTMMFDNDTGMITVILRNEDGRTRIEISRLTGTGKKSGESSTE
jgi:hypothetical protein